MSVEPVMARRQPYAHPMVAELSAFYTYEADLLDTYRMHEWLALLTDDFVYTMPVPTVLEDVPNPTYEKDTYIVHEDRRSLEYSARRRDPDVYPEAWGENPSQRIRHFVTNVRVDDGEEPGTWDTRVNVLLTFTRMTDEPIVVSAERNDLLRSEDDGEVKLARRTVYVDDPVVRLTHLRVIL